MVSPVPRPLRDLMLPKWAHKGKHHLFDRDGAPVNAANPPPPLPLHMRLVGQPWSKFEAYRHRVTFNPARMLDRADRQAAARDPGLEWDEQTRSYRLRRKGHPAPSPANSGGIDG